MAIKSIAQIKCSVFDVGVAFGKSHPGISAVALSSSQSARVAEHVTAVDRQLSVENWQALRAAGVIAADYAYVP